MLKLKDVKRLWFIVLGVIVAGGAVYIYMHRHDLGLVPPSGEDAGQPHPARISWTPVDRSPEGFKVEMPEDTKEIEVPAYTDQGSANQVAMIYSYPDPATSFSVSWADNPPVERAVGENPDQTLNSARDGALTRTQAILVSESSSNRQGYLTRDFVARNEGGGIFNARLILVGRRLYLLMAAFPAVSARRDADVNHFLNSFQIVRNSPAS